MKNIKKNEWNTVFGGNKGASIDYSNLDEYSKMLLRQINQTVAEGFVCQVTLTNSKQIQGAVCRKPRD